MNYSKSARHIVFLLFMLSAALVLGTGCKSSNDAPISAEPSYTVTFINMSEQRISEIHFKQNLSSGGSMNADGSPIEYGESLFFDFDSPDTSALFSVLDEEKKVLLSETVELSFNEEKNITIHMEDDKEGVAFKVVSP
ncbi:hypothetical protein J3A84_01235 [Proteiniclasticum sp. SCR006]|uniref:Lipoprotein n=1 Tax=Proteiniclasticum aestuarii TaxID=2817862 RepID=A0A939H3X1_9CLOT|nr:hypothetical protein [Proteiniclasticum aestuarii]MBO1263664.1 hypothetical protein [Proteiniclasticum aestuarii]